MVEGGMTCVKYLLFAFNFIFFIIGLGLIICGAVVQANFREYFEIIGSEFSVAAGLLISVGVIIFIIGFFGCCGAVKENQCMVMTFAILLGIIFVLEIAAGIVGFQMRAEVEAGVAKALGTSLSKYENATATRKAWDAIQRNLHCCGVNTGYADWNDKLSGGQEYPKSCCKKGDEDKPECGTAPGLAYKDPCVPKMKETIESNTLWIGVVGICMSFIQIVGIVFACCLARSIRKEYESV